MRTKGIGTIASFGIITFGLVSTFFTVYSLILPTLSTSAEGPSYATSSEVGINVKESIKIAVDKDHLALVDGEGSTQIAPSASGTLVTGDVNVAVTTNAYGGYRLGVYTSDATTDMKHNNDSVNAVVSSIAGASGYDVTTGMSSLSPNTWGFRKYIEAEGANPASWSNWYGVGNNSTNMAIIDIKDIGEGPSTYCNDLSQPVADSGCSSSSYDTYKVGFGANLTSSLPAGTYTNNIIFSALTNEASTFLTFNANAPSGATVSGSMAPKSILKGSTVTLPNTTTFKRDGFGIKGWALQSGATTVATVEQPDPANPGSTITVQLTPGATVDVDSLISATGIPSSTTGPIPLYAVWDNAYTINYIANNPEGTTVTGTMDSSNAILGLNTTIPSTSYEIDNYTLKGWAFTADATDPASISEAGAKDLISGATFTTQQLITAASSAGQSVSTSTAGTITLYAIWKNGYSEDTMQGWTGCASLATGSSVMLTDVRDNKEYAVKKLPDDKCWMMQNLTINGVELTPKDTNIADGNTYYLPKDGGAGSLTDPATKDATTGYNFTNGYDNQAMFKFRSKDTSVTNDSDTGYYNFYTATLGYSYYGDNRNSGTSPQDICPKNWRMPRTTDAGTGGWPTTDTNNDFIYLARQYPSSWSGTSTSYNYSTSSSAAITSMHTGAASPLATSVDNNYAGFSHSGVWSNTNNSATSVGVWGYYWSASTYNSYNVYHLRFDESSLIYPQYTTAQFDGYAVRCVNDYFEYMQDFDSNNLASGASTTLRDKRDNQKYTVYRVPTDATYPSTSDIANVAGKVIMTQDLNLGAKASVPGSASTIIANGAMTLSPEDSGFTEPTGTDYESITVPTASVSITNGTGSWDTSTNSYSNKQYTTSGTGDYKNRGYYSWGAAMTVCPKGWRLPTDAEYNNGSSYNSSTTGISKLVNNNLTIQSPPWSFVLGGFFYSGSFYDARSYGYYWSSTQYSSTNSHFLLLDSHNGLARSNVYKYYGNAVRCIAD